MLDVQDVIVYLPLELVLCVYFVAGASMVGGVLRCSTFELGLGASWHFPASELSWRLLFLSGSSLNCSWGAVNLSFWSGTNLHAVEWWWILC